MSKTAWDRQDIVAAVKKRGSSLARLAIEHGYKRGSLHRSLYKRYPKAHGIIASYLGVPASVIWPHWYGQGEQASRQRRAA